MNACLANNIVNVRTGSPWSETLAQTYRHVVWFKTVNRHVWAISQQLSFFITDFKYSLE